MVEILDSSDEDEAAEVKTPKPRRKKQPLFADESDDDDAAPYKPPPTTSDAEDDRKPVVKAGGKTGKAFLADDVKSSTKIDAVVKVRLRVCEPRLMVQYLRKTREQDENAFAVVFSKCAVVHADCADVRSFTGFLDLLQRVLAREGFEYCRLDGTLSQKQREGVLRHFNKSKRPLVMICSTKVGCVMSVLYACSRAKVASVSI